MSFYLDENTLVAAPRTECVPCTHRLDFDFPHIRQQIATTTAIKKIIPNMQKASANLDVDRHSVPSDGVARTLE